MNNFFTSFKASLTLRFVYLIFVVFLVLILGNPIYGTTDDYILSSFIDGNYTGNSEIRSIFIEPLISLIMYYFQILVPGVTIYSIFLLIILILSLSFLGSVINKRNSSKYLDLIWLLFSSGIVIWFTLSPTYTASSMASAAINLTSLMILISNKIELKNQKIIIVAISILFSLSYLIRPESGNAVLAIFLIFIILKIIREINMKTINYKNYLLSILTFCLIYALNFVLTQAQKNDEWSIYNSWNSMRHQIQQRLPEEKLLDLRTEIGWTIPEYHLFMNLSFGDSKEFNSEWLEPAFVETKSDRGIAVIMYIDKNIIFQKTIETFDKYQNYIILNLIILIFMITFFKFNKYNYLITILSVLLITIIICYISITLHTPERVIVPLLLFPLLLTIYTLSSENINPRKGVSNIYFFSTAIALTIVLGIIFNLKNSENLSKIVEANLKNKWLREFENTAIFIGPVGTETYHLNSPYLKQKINGLPTIFTTGNWETFSPNWFKRMNFLGFKSKSVYENLFDDKVFWISYPQPDSAYLVELYLKEKNYPSFKRENIKEHNSGLTIYKFNEAN